MHEFSGRPAVAAALVLASLVGTAPAKADIFDLTFTNTVQPSDACCGGPFSISAQLTATFNGTNYDITGISGTVTESAGNPGIYAITGLAPGVSGEVDDAYFYSNQISAGPIFNFNATGIAFFSNAPTYYDIHGQGAPVNPNTDIPSVFNVWWNGNGTSYTLGTTASNDLNAEFNGVGNISAVPGPIVGAGLPGLIAACGAALGLWRRKRRGTAAAA